MTMTDALTLADMQALLTKLAAAYNHPMTDTQQRALGPLWLDVLRALPRAEVEAAVAEAIRNPGRFMPRPGDIRRAAEERAQRTFAPNAARGPRVVWHTDPSPWNVYANVENAGWVNAGPDGEPVLCLGCFNLDVRFVRKGGVDHAYLRHRPGCPKAVGVVQDAPPATGRAATEGV